LLSLTPLALQLFLKGVAIGIAISAPVGPVAILCIRRTLEHGRAVGLASGLGAVVADVFYGALASFGVAAVAGLLLEYEIAMRVAGGAFLLFVGVRTWLKDDDGGDTGGAGRLFQSFGSAFLLTVSNPLTILAFTAIFAGAGVINAGMDLIATGALIAGVATGTIFWWGGLTLIASLFREKIGKTGFVWLHHFSGGVLVLFGVVSIGSVFVI
jgi:threonine/homoserine/homoserine lactone efflux protein